MCILSIHLPSGKQICLLANAIILQRLLRHFRDRGAKHSQFTHVCISCSGGGPQKAEITMKTSDLRV